MKIRSTFLALAALLMMGPLAQAAQTATAADTATANLAAIFAVPRSPEGAKAPEAALPSFAPAPTAKAGLACGSCSDSLCAGKPQGTVCKTSGGKIYKCQFAYIVCSPNDCECWTGPLP